MRKGFGLLLVVIAVLAAWYVSLASGVAIGLVGAVVINPKPFTNLIAERKKQ